MVPGPAEARGLIATFTGVATLRTDYLFFPGPFDTDITYDLTFSEDRKNVSLLPFREIEFEAGGQHITISIKAGGEGTFAKTTGEMKIPTTFQFETDVVGNPTIQLTLSTGTASPPSGKLDPILGSPLNAATGAIAIVGASEFEGGDPAIDGVDCTIEFAGTLSPVP